MGDYTWETTGGQRETTGDHGRLHMGDHGRPRGGNGRPRETTHGRPRETTGDYGRPRETTHGRQLGTFCFAPPLYQTLKKPPGPHKLSLLGELNS
eukprot:9385035-Heterocapsa_arctica.AAC.1